MLLISGFANFNPLSFRLRQQVALPLKNSLSLFHSFTLSQLFLLQTDQNNIPLFFTLINFAPSSVRESPVLMSSTKY